MRIFVIIFKIIYCSLLALVSFFIIGIFVFYLFILHEKIETKYFLYLIPPLLIGPYFSRLAYFHSKELQGTSAKKDSGVEKIGVEKEVEKESKNREMKKVGIWRNFKQRKIIFSAAVLVVILFLGASAVFFFQGRRGVVKPGRLATVDDFPVWLLRDGKVAVYRELNFYQDSIEKNIIVSNLGDESQKNIQIYESIPKEFAQNISELTFNVQPQIIKEDPVVSFSVETDKKGQRVILVFGKRIKFANVTNTCRSEEVIPQMLELKLNPESFYDCTQFWKIKDEEAQQKALEEFQAKQEKVAEVLKPGAPKYDEIKQKAKEIIAKKSVELQFSAAPAQEPAKPTETPAQKFPQTVYFSNSMFPETLSGLPRVKFIEQPDDPENCFTKTVPASRFASAIYRQGERIIVVSAAQYKNSEQAKLVPKKCVDAFTTEYLAKLGISQTALEQKGVVRSRHPFWLVKAVYKGSPLIINSYAAVEDTVFAVMIPDDTGGTETEHRQIMEEVLGWQKIGCGGDSDCANWVSNNTSGRKICSNAECVDCTDNSHCKDGYKCENKTCKHQETPAAAAPSPKPASEPICGNVNLSTDYRLYKYAKLAAPCSEYQNSFSANKLSLKCGQSSSQWRNYWVKEFEVAGNKKLKITADLGLVEHAGFFQSECGGQGVKSDDYVDLIVLSFDPKAALDAECDKTVSESDWPKCAVLNSGSSVLAHCGVSKCSASKKCDLEIGVEGLAKIYFVFRTADAWLADVEGMLSSLKVCGTE